MANKKTQKILVGLLIISSFIFLVTYAKPNTILAQSQVNVGTDGKVYWVATGIADNLDSGYTFNYAKPSPYPLSNGETVTPQSGFTVTLKTIEKSCTYQLIPKTKSLVNIPIVPYIYSYNYVYPYWTLANAEKKFLIKATPSKGVSVTMDGSLSSSETLTDPDGKGKLTISTVGALGSKYDCPNYADIAVISSSNSQLKKVVSKSQLENALNVPTNLILNVLSLITNPAYFNDIILGKISEETSFTQEFTSFPTITDSYIKGEKDMGSPLFTITADQDFFNSIIYRPPISSDPYIESINIPSIESGTQGTFSVIVKNRVSSQGNVILKLSGQYSTIQPSSQNFLLTGSATKYFTITENVFSSETTESITAEVCTNNQFGTNKCDSKTVTHLITPDTLHICGDGVCNSLYETATTCPSDCHSPVNCTITAESCSSDNDCCSKSCFNGKCVESAECSDCDAFALSYLVGSVWKEKQCTPKSVSILPPSLGQGVTICWLSLLKILLVPISLIFSYLVSIEFLMRFSEVRKNDALKMILSLVISIVIAYIVYVSFLIGIVVFIAYLILSSAFKTAQAYVGLR